MRRRGDLSDIAQQLRVLRRVVEVVVAHQQPERLAAELAVLLLIEAPEDRALVPGGAAELLKRPPEIFL